MTSPTYPASADVSAGQPTSFTQYNRLRADALRFNASETDAIPLGRFLGQYSSGLRISYLSTNRLRIIHDNLFPPTLMIEGYMSQSAANVDLAAGSFSGPNADWYVFANRVAGSSSFTLSVNTSAVEGPGQRLIGKCHWDGSALVASSIQTYRSGLAGAPMAVISLNGSLQNTTQTSYTATNVCHHKLDFNILKQGAKAAYLVANFFTASATGYVRFYDSSAGVTIVELTTTSTSAVTIVKSADILSALPDTEVETRLEYKTSGTRVDCYWAALMIEY